MLNSRLAALVVCASSLVAACASLPIPDPDGPPAQSVTGLVSAAHPDAVAAGAAVLEAGGSAVDAAVAVQAVLGLVEPQSSGIGGGAFLLHYEAATGVVTGYNGRETAPAATTPALFLDDDGAPMGRLAAMHSGLSTGAPGAVDMLALAHSDLGVLAWDTLFDDAIDLAEDGFVVGERLAGLLQLATRFGLDQGPWAGEYLYKDDGAPLVAGDRVVNVDYANSLRQIAADPRALYEGDLADRIVATVRTPPMAGTLSRADLAAYRAQRVDPICAPYRGDTICGMPPPASGGVAIGQFTGLLERFEFDADGADSAYNWRLFVEAQRLAYADRDRFVADPDVVAVPIGGMLNPDYLDARAALITPDKAIATATAGDPWAAMGQDRAVGDDATQEPAGTSHFVVRDTRGNVVSMTTTVEGPFGSTRMTGGFFLNNQLTDFSFEPVDADGRAIANAVAPGKRPRSSMSPTIVLDADGDFKFATGSPGGNSIIAYTAKSLVGVLDWGLTPQQAADLPNVVARGDTVRVETARAPEWLSPALIESQHQVEESAGETSGIHSVLVLPDGTLLGAADPRREGVVATVR